MSVRDVTNLRKEGKLKEAYNLAKQELEECPDEWTRMSLFWVLRDIVLKIYIPNRNKDHALACLDIMGRLLPDMLDDNGAGERAYQSLCKQLLPNADAVKQASELSKTDPNIAYENITELFGKDAKGLDSKFHEDYGWIIYRYMKANSDQLTSVQIRCLLRDYMQLKNERPSLLHSMIINYAINFSKDHSDFNFYKFFILWGIENLRYDDYNEGWTEGHEIPSLVSRICRTIIDSGEEFDAADFVSKFTDQDSVTEHLRQAYFWKLMNLQKNNDYEVLWQSFDRYAEAFSCLGASQWHSEILKIANRFMVNNDSVRLISFAMKWCGSGNFRNEDWKKEKNDEDKEFPSLAEKTAKNCFETLKTTPLESLPDGTSTWLKDLYRQIKENDLDDDWNARNYATICNWCGDTDEAVAIYKSLLLHMPDKYYLWSELSDLQKEDNTIRIGLLLKAKNSEKNEDFIGDIHLALASLWQAEGYGTIANHELDAYAKHRKEKGWNVSDKYRELQANASSCCNKEEQIDFAEYIKKAEEFVYADFDWTDYVLVDKWTHEGSESCRLYADKDSSFVINTKRFPILKKTKVGDVIQFKCNIVEETKLDDKSPFWNRRTITLKHIIPLIAQKTDQQPWSSLPQKYGVIDYINESKHVFHILTQESKQTFCEYKGIPFAVNSFVKFREYEDKHKEEVRTCIANVKACSPEEALPNMRSRVVVVDDVNERKNLFHVVLGQGKISDVVRFDQTDIRPSIGDFLRVTYCIKKNKEGKKHIKFLDIKKTGEECPGVLRTITGRLELKYRFDYYDEDDEPDFAFVNDYYVHRSLLKKYNIKHDCNVIAKAVLGGDDKWKVFDINLQ